MFQELVFYKHVGGQVDVARLERLGCAESLSAVMSLSDQAAPYVCGREGDGDLDIVVSQEISLQVLDTDRHHC